MIGPFTFERGIATSVVTAINLLAANVSSSASINLPGQFGKWIESVTNGVPSLSTPTPAQIGAPYGSGTSTGTNTGDQTITLTGPITGSGTGNIAVSIASQTGTGSKFVMDTGPTVSAITLSNNPTITSTVQVTGLNAPAAGAGVEIAYAAGIGYFVSYDRTNSLYKSIQMQGSDYQFFVGGVTSPLELDSLFRVKILGAFYPATDAGAAQTTVAVRAGSATPNNANGNDGDVYFQSTGATTLWRRQTGAWVAKA
jgi:hypothetical protein